MIYAQHREDTTFKPILCCNSNRQGYLGDSFTQAHRNANRSGLVFRGGVIWNLKKPLLLRLGYSYVRTYSDMPGAHSLETGIGYRFGN
jgi:opacity protein-like surface antigen